MSGGSIGPTVTVWTHTSKCLTCLFVWAAGPVLLLAGSVVLGTGHSKLPNGAALPATNGAVHKAQHSDGSGGGGGSSGNGLLAGSSPNTSESASEVEVVTRAAGNGVADAAAAHSLQPHPHSEAQHADAIAAPRLLDHTQQYLCTSAVVARAPLPASLRWQPCSAPMMCIKPSCCCRRRCHPAAGAPNGRGSHAGEVESGSITQHRGFQVFVSRAQVLRLAPVYTWPPVELRSEAGDVVDAALQPDRSAWSRRHAALRRIDEMSLSTTQLECAPPPAAAVARMRRMAAGKEGGTAHRCQRFACIARTAAHGLLCKFMMQSAGMWLVSVLGRVLTAVLHCLADSSSAAAQF